MNFLGASGKLLPLWSGKQIASPMILAEREQRSPECLKQLEAGDREPAPYPLSLTSCDTEQITLTIRTSGPPLHFIASHCPVPT